MGFEAIPKIDKKTKKVNNINIITYFLIFNERRWHYESALLLPCITKYNNWPILDIFGHSRLSAYLGCFFTPVAFLVVSTPRTTEYCFFSLNRVHERGEDISLEQADKLHANEGF